MIQVIKDSQWFTSLEQIYEYANKQGETYLAIGIRNSIDKGYDLRTNDSLADILQLQAEIEKLKAVYFEDTRLAKEAMLIQKDCIEKLKAEIVAKDNQIVQAGLIVDAIDMILSNGEEPSDFEMSFPLVREVWDRHEKCMKHEADLATSQERIRELEQQREETALHYEGDDGLVTELAKDNEVLTARNRELEKDIEFQVYQTGMNGQLLIEERERNRELEELTKQQVEEIDWQFNSNRELTEALEKIVCAIEDNTFDVREPIPYILRIAKKALDVEGDDTISDGFGSSWSAYCAMCGKKSMHIVRPGKVQCSFCE